MTTYAVEDATLTLTAATRPTMYFVGVSTAHSSIRQVFPRWADALGLGDAELVGIDLPIHADPRLYRQVVNFIRDDPHSRGALVTTHKLDLFHAASTLFDTIDPLAELMGEASCISKRGDNLVATAKDPISSGFALQSLVPSGHWSRTGAEVLCLGAGGSAIAITWYLSRPVHGDDRPSRLVVTDRNAERLHHIRSVHADMGLELPVDYVIAGDGDNDRYLERLSPGSLVINATGLGKDRPGSPLGPTARFPEAGLAWDLNYRGDLVFLEQARAQAAERSLHVEDGWHYFLHGWTQAIAEVFAIDVPTSGPGFDELAARAAATPRSAT